MDTGTLRCTRLVIKASDLEEMAVPDYVFYAVSEDAAKRVVEELERVIDLSITRDPSPPDPAMPWRVAGNRKVPGDIRTLWSETVLLMAGQVVFLGSQPDESPN